MNYRQPLLIATTVLTGLTAGLFFGFSVSVNPAFLRLTDVQYITAMQAINDVIVNPVFMIAFMGPVFLLPVLGYSYAKQRSEGRLPLIIAAIAYVIGTFGVTVACNVPLNDALAAFDVAAASPQQAAAARQQFANPWNSWHTIRTVFNVIA
ncbi:DUF1772 domain-containing protein, partial [Chitinophaga sp. Mgbs1]|nr:DUF1772 domain-containing protein [Chitinophaga solisilvae]